MCPVLDQRSPGDLVSGSVYGRNRPPRASTEELFPGLRAVHHRSVCFQVGVQQSPSRERTQQTARVAEGKQAVRWHPQEGSAPGTSKGT